MTLTKKQKSFALSEARKWVKFKIKVEKPFYRELRAYFSKQTKRIKLGFDLETIAPVLDHHYKRIIREITGIRIKDFGEFANVRRMQSLLLGRSINQAQYIDKTTNKNFKRSVELAKAELSEEGVLFPSIALLNSIASNIFRGYSKGRSSSIKVTETQEFVEEVRDEESKISEEMMNEAIDKRDKELAEDALLLSPSMAGQTILDNIDTYTALTLFSLLDNMMKTWVTMGDAKVRPWHNAANYQTVQAKEPFIVMGEMLMYPGDMSMGASLKNVSRCRCVKVNM